MYLKWKQRLEKEPYLRQVNEWIEIDVSSLPKSKRSNFLRNVNITSKVANGTLVKDAARESNISPSAVSRLMNKTFSGDENSTPALTSALIPMARTHKDKRRSKLSSYGNPVGARCSFKYLLDTVPGLSNYLNEIVKLYVNQAHNCENLTPGSFHNKFLSYLSDHNWPTDKYPFDQVTMGYETCRKYFHFLKAQYSIPKTRSFRVLRNNPIENAYEEIQIDSQTLDIHTSANFEFNGNTSPHRLSRMTLFIAIDVATDCILAYKLCFTESPTQYDLLDLLISINKKWEPRKLTTPGLLYEPGACFPNHLGSCHLNAGIGTVSLDNALCHHSYTVQSHICNEMGASIKYGLPATPKDRNVVEYAFRRLNRFIHRFSSTTGSHPKDELKESLKNAKKPPILTVTALEDVLSVVLTHHNNKPQKRLYGHSPLSLIQSQMNNRLIRINHHISSSQTNHYIREKKVKVCWSIKEKRHPYVHFEGLRYSAPHVLDASLIKQEVIIKYDYRDIRKIEAITTNGKIIGTLDAPLTWQIHKHSINTRKYILGLIKQKLITGVDPLNGTFEYLRIHKNLPSEALRITELIKDVTEGQTINKAANDNEFKKSSRNKHVQKTKIKWHPQIIKNGETL